MCEYGKIQDSHCINDSYRHDIIVKEHPLAIALDDGYIMTMVRTAENI